MLIFFVEDHDADWKLKTSPWSACQIQQHAQRHMSPLIDQWLLAMCSMWDLSVTKCAISILNGSSCRILNVMNIVWKAGCTQKMECCLQKLNCSFWHCWQKEESLMNPTFLLWYCSHSLLLNAIWYPFLQFMVDTYDKRNGTNVMM